MRGRGKANAFSRRIASEACSQQRRQDHAHEKGKRSAERRMSYQCPRLARRARSFTCAPTFRRSRSRHSPPVPPDGSASEPGFPRRRLAGVLPASPKSLPRLSTLRADRSFCRPTGAPKPPRERIGNSARGHRISLRCYGMPSGTAPFNEQDGGGYRHRRDKVKDVRVSDDVSKNFGARGFLKVRGTPMILGRSN